MANVKVDFDLVSGANDGTTWPNAFQTLAAVTASDGDDIWVQGDTANISGGNVTMTFGSTSNPVKWHGCKQGTTNDPPIASDLTPGWRTGEVRTIANRAYKDTTDAPLVDVTDTSRLNFNGHQYFYGIRFQLAGGRFQIGNAAKDHIVFEECLIDAVSGGVLVELCISARASCRLINCGYTTNHISCQIHLVGHSEVIGLEHTATTVPTQLFGTTVNGFASRLIGCDFSGNSGIITGVASAFPSTFEMLNCALHASVTFITGTANEVFRYEMHGCSPDTGKSSGSILNMDIASEAGNITEETTAVRTGGADDGEAGGHSMAMTPLVNGTRDNYYSLVGPWMAFWITNTDTAVDVFISNSGAGDYNDDDAWLEVMGVSEVGTAQHTQLTTQMDLQATPAAITDDGSTWGTGGNNPQKLSAAISPDFSGWAYCRVHFAKNFGASPETLFVDPNPVTS